MVLQRTLHGASWPGGLDLRVRVALHTGEAHERDGDYFGPALNRAARLRGVARGGATVMSQATAEIVHDRLPPETGLVELGRQELRGLSRPENVFELRATAPAALAGESALNAPRMAGCGARCGGRAGCATERSPARPADTHHRPRGGPLRHRDAVAPRRHPPGHAHRAGRGGKDAPGARGGAVARGRVSGRRLVCFARRDRERRARCERDRTSRGRHATRGGNAQAGGRAFPRPEARAAGARQLRAPPAGGPADQRPVGHRSGAGRDRDQPRGPATASGAALRRRPTTSSQQRPTQAPSRKPRPAHCSSSAPAATTEASS